MSPRSLSVCTTPGCPVLVERPGGCAAHEAERRARDNARRGPARQRPYDGKWKTTRAEQLQRHPFCHDCLPKPVRAVEVHHLDGLGPDGPLGHHRSNLMSLCKPHHTGRTNAMRAT